MALVIVPITSKVSKKTEQPTHYLIHKTQGLSYDSIALGEQITTIDKRQCLKYLGRLSRKETDAIKEAALCGIGGNIDIPEESCSGNALHSGIVVLKSLLFSPHSYLW